MWNRRGLQLRNLTVLALLVATATANGASVRPRLPLALVEQVLVSTAHDEFENYAVFEAATKWHGERLLQSPSRQAPHLACAEYSNGSQALLKLEARLPSGAIRKVSNHKLHGTCFIVTASASTAADMNDHMRDFDVTSFGPIPATLKLAPELLDHDGPELEEGRLTTRHGERMRLENVIGLDVALSPGVLTTREEADTFISDLMQGLMSGSLDLHRNNFWSDSDGDHDDVSRSHPGGALRAREWTRAAGVVHGLSDSGGGHSPGDICSWGDLNVRYAGSDTVYITGKSRSF